MKTIHLTCGHKLKVKTWPSRAGLVKIRHHYKVYHPSRMKKMTKKSLATKRKRGLIRNRCNPKIAGQYYVQRGNWYVGSNRVSRKGEIFESHFVPTQKTHGRFFLYVTGPFKSIEEAQKYKRGMDLA